MNNQKMASLLGHPVYNSVK